MTTEKGGCPLTYNEEIANEICDIVSTTPKMLEEICEENQDFPTAKTIYQWRIRYPEFGEKYAKAKQAQIECLVSQILFKAREVSHDFYYPGDGKVSINMAAIKRLQIEVDAIKWFAGKLAPKLYGDKSKEKDNHDNDDEAINKAKDVSNKCMKEI